MPYADLIRRVNDIERMVKRHVVSDHPGAGDVARAYARFLAIPNLRAFWPFSSREDGGAGAMEIGDASGFGNHASSASAGLAAGLWDGQVPYATFAGASGDYLTVANNTYVQITGDVIVGCWIRVSAWPASGGERVICKGQNALDSRCYQLIVESTQTFEFLVSSDGTSGGTVGGGNRPAELGKWHFAWGQFNTSTWVKSGLDGDVSENTTSIPATMNSNTANLALGAQGNGNTPMQADMCFAFLATPNPALVSDDYMRGLWEATRGLFVV